jgi:hypothetical protein
VLSLNIYEASEVVDVDPADDAIDEARLALIWDSSGPDLATLELCRPSNANWPGEALRLLTAEVAEDDLDEIRDEREESGDDLGDPE